MSVAITIDRAVKKYGDVTIIPGLSLRIENGELFTLLGPSGCGKTTLLRMIAGFNSIEGGKFKFNDRVINDMDPGKRNIGMVFQNYAIFPNLTVRKNVEFGLKHRKVSKETVKRETDKFLKLVHMDRYADRMPAKLSGGQQQRVALARALAIQPDVLLMDEPLSNLDAKLRVEMRTAIKEIQKNIGITTVYVTHDQEEAMAISDRIAVMKSGVIHHCSDPQNIYQRPADLFVATFIGKTNLLKGKLIIENGVNYVVFNHGYKIEIDNIRAEERKAREVIISVRPEEFFVDLHEDKMDGEGIKARILNSVFLGLHIHYLVELETGEKVEIIQQSDIDSILPQDTNILLTLDTKKINIFDVKTTMNIVEGVKNYVTSPFANKNMEVG